MSRSHFTLFNADRAYLQALVRKQTVSRRAFQRASALLQLDQGQTLLNIANNFNVSRVTIAKWRDRYQQDGLSVLQDRPRSGRPVQIDGRQRAKITALACSTPPRGHARWSLRLLADKVVELGYISSISHKQVGQILKKTNCSRT